MKNFFPQKETVLSLQIKDGSLRAVLVSLDPRKKRSLLACESCALEGGFDEALEIIRGLLKKAGRNLKAVLLILDREEVLLRNFRLLTKGGPEETEQEVLEMISQYIPYDISEIVRDYHLIRPESPERAVSVVIGHRRVVDEKLTFLKAISLVPDRVAYSSEAIFLACQKQNREWTQTEGTLFLDIDTKSSELIFASQGEILFSKKLNLGSLDYEGADAVTFSRFFREIEVLLREDYPLPAGRRITKVVLAGRYPSQGRLEAVIKENFGLEPEVFKIESSEGAPFSLTPHLGALEAILPNSLNLLPQEIKQEKRRDEATLRQNQFLQAGAALGVALLLLFASHLGARQFYLLNMDKRIERLRAKTVGIEETALGLRLRGKQEKNKWVLLETLAALHKMTPPDTIMTEIEYDRKTGLTLQGTAPTNQQVTEYFNRLRNLPFASKWTLDYSQKKKIGDEEIFYFQIQLGLRERPL